MSSRIYITNKLPEHYDAISKSTANWDQWAAIPDVGQGSYTSFTIDTNKYGDPPSTVSAVVTPTARPWRVGLYAGVSRPLILPQVRRGPVKLVLSVAQTIVAKVYTKFNLFIIDSTDGLNNGVYKTTVFNYEDGPSDGSPNSKKGIEWPYLADPNFPTPAPIVLNFNGRFDAPYHFSLPADGREYRLVLEIGAISYADVGDVGLQHIFGVRYDNLMPRADLLSAGGSTYIELSETSPEQIQFDNYKHLPPNHEVELATSINLGVTQIVNEPYRYYYRWYKYTPVLDTVLSLQAYSEAGGGSSLQLYMQETKGQVPDIPATDYGVSGENVVFNHAVQVGRKLLIKTRPISEFTYNWALNLVQSPNVTVKKGDLFISSDEFNPNLYDSTLRGLYPVIWHSPTLGDIRVLSGKYPATKVGTCLANGKWALSQPFTGEVFLFRRAPFLNMLERIQTGLTDGISTMGTDSHDIWVLGRMPNFNGGENRTLIKITKGITVEPVKLTLPLTTAGGALNGAASMGASRDGSVLYYNDYELGGLVQRHDLNANAQMSPFDASPGVDFYPEDIIVLFDSTICCLFRNVDNTANWIYHFDVDGTLLHSFQGSLGPIHHISLSSDDLPDRIQAWHHYNYPNPTSPITNAFALYNVDGTQISGFGQTYGYVNGRGPTILVGSETQPRWGSALKGSLIPMMIPPEISGIYFLNPDNKHDIYNNNVENRIPTPTIRTALLGE